MSTEWTNVNGGNWTTSGDWTSGVPTSSTDAIIGVAGGYTVTLDGESGQANSLTISDASAALSINSGGNLAIAGTLSNSGTLDIDTQGGSVGSVVNVGGGLTNSGTIDIGTGGGAGDSSLTMAGTLTNSGTLNIADDVASATTVVSAGALVDAGVIAGQGTINLNGASGGTAELIVAAGSAPGTLTTSTTLFGASLLEYASGQITSIAGSGELIVGGGRSFVADAGATTSESALTTLSSVAGDFELQSGGALALSGGLALSGHLNMDTEGASVGSVLSVANLTDSGTIDIGTGGGAGNTTLTVAGTLTNSGTLTIDDNVVSATVVSAGALVDGGIVAGDGTINLNGAGGGAAELIIATGSAPGTLTTSTTLFGSSLLEYASGQITSIAGSGELIVGGGKSFVADAGATTSESALTVLSSVAGDFELQSGGALALSGGLAVTGHLNMDTEGSSVGSLLSVASLTNTGTIDIGTGGGAGDSSLTVAGTLTNSGTLTIDDDVVSATVVSAGALADTGTINLNGAGGGAAELIVATGSAPGALSTTITLFGSSLLEYASGQITSITSGGELIVGGGQSFVADAGAASESALTVLSSVAGDFELQSGGALSLSGGLAVTGHLNMDTNGGSVASLLSVASLTNSGTIDIGTGGGAGDSSLTVAGTLTNSGTLTIDDHVVSATVVSAGALADTGTISLNGAGVAAAELIVASGSAPGTLTTSITLFGSSLLEYASGQITSIAGSGGLVVGGGQAFVADAGATTSESALTTLSSVAGDFELQSGGALALSGGLAVTGHLNMDTDGGSVASLLSVASLTNSGTIDIGTGGGAGDSSLTVAGTLTNSGTLVIEDRVTSATVVSAGALANTGTISLDGAGVGAAELVIAGALSDTGSITLTGSALLSAGGGLTVTNGGSVTVAAGGTTGNVIVGSGGTLDLLSGGVVSGGISFSGSGGQLQIGGAAMPTNTISGFVPGDSFDLANIALDKTSGSASLGANNQLQITESGTTYDLNLNPSENFTGDTFQLAPDTGSGTLVIENNTPCYCRGTLLLTERGEAAVEDLAIGDRVVTAAGAAKPIKWIGRRSYQGRFVAGNRSILPVCVKAGALADGLPRRDLWVSPNHALYLEGVLIEARDLINGVSIDQAERVAAVEYFHIELDSHDLLVAEGAAAESFLDDDNRELFHNAHEYRALHPDAPAGPARYCVPRCDAGWEVERARTAIARRAGLAVTAEGPAPGTLRGQIEAVGRRWISGWAQDAAHPEAPVCLDILAGGELIGQVAANRFRADLAAAGLGSGRHGFEFVPPAGLAFTPRSIAVRRSLDGASLTGLRRSAAGSPRASTAKG